jgi:hypothetical protein
MFALRFILSKIWHIVMKYNSNMTRTDLYKCLAFMALVQQGKAVDEKLLDNYVNRGSTMKQLLNIIFGTT